MSFKSREFALIPIGPRSGGSACARCGTETEPIETNMDGVPVEQLELCPECYLVTWRDDEGFHVRQGLPAQGGVGSMPAPEHLFYAHERRSLLC
jgi:hypothetical protein